MASNDVDDADITVCAICLEQLNIPKQLPCLHTFCESCITSYITSVFKKTNASLDCPVCRSTVSIQENNEDADFAKSIRTNVYVGNVIERRKLHRTGKVCMSCERMNASTESVAVFVCVNCSDSLCQTCVNYHRSNKSSVHHKLLPMTDWSTDHLLPYRPICFEHTSKYLEGFCVDHNDFCCFHCLLQQHRMCKQVVSLEDAAKIFKETDSMTEISELIDRVKSDLTNIVDNARTAIEVLEKNKTSELERFVDCWKRIHSKLDEIESERRQEYEKLFDAERDRLETIITEFENKRKIVITSNGILKTVKNESSDILTMVEGQKIKRRLSEIDSCVTENYQKEKMEFNFENLEAVEEKITAVCTKLRAVTVISRDNNSRDSSSINLSRLTDDGVLRKSKTFHTPKVRVSLRKNRKKTVMQKSASAVRINGDVTQIK